MLWLSVAFNLLRWRTFAALQKDTIRRKVIVNSSGASPKPRLQSAAARVATAKGS